MKKEDTVVHVIAFIVFLLITLYGFHTLVTTIDSAGPLMTDAVGGGFIFLTGMIGIYLQYYLYTKRKD